MGGSKRVVVVWPQYLDLTLPRRLGRKLPKNYSVTKPTLDELVSACKELKLECVAERDAKYCRTWYLGSSGRIIINVSDDVRKLDLLKALSNKIRELRAMSSRSLPRSER
ncbi:MAG: signal recognition particle subunit SRP19/SEC65 family protein [Sulfolobales archaeon]